MTVTDDIGRLLARHSVRELTARGRALALLDDGSAHELLGPFDHLESPWLEPQGVVPQADDGVVVMRGSIGGHRAVVAAVEQGFQGGAIGEVSGAKISETLRLAAADGSAGTPVTAVLLLETGGVRLQEANLGLAAVAEICDAVLVARTHAPVIAVIAGEVGSFGGVSIAAGLCTEVIMTREGRLGLNGPAVIEQEAGRTEFDASDRALVWAVHGGTQRHAQALADRLIVDDIDELRDAVAAAVTAGVKAVGSHRSERVDVLAARLALLDPATTPTPAQTRELWGAHYEVPEAVPTPAPVPSASPGPASRGFTWLKLLSGVDTPDAVIASVRMAVTDQAVYLAVVPDPASPYHRARHGEVGLAECLALAQTLRRIVAEDAARPQRRAIVAVVDLPSQAYGRIEETAGLHQAIATTVDAYAAARTAGHPVVTIVVGTALSGGFLTHGLQATRILALDAPGVEIHAMHKPAAARITRRTVDQLEQLGSRIAPLSYDVRTWATLGLCDALLPVADADHPTDAETATVTAALQQQIEAARTPVADLSYRLDTPGALHLRGASRHVRDELARQWAAER
ncbi:biotin-independent malonate decarboxylase subunit beta [Winogradskya humida]|uniref:Biotin-independent malonate decarboxylase subunit beta n=1 Tax=Winogradskya humida TaxID=113566 RepID=A0ABQ4A6A9_9ACTN|nr:biotin-independent malonate decarboxylase subunit beta [Actinoplanes humidus]GIE26395.1 biotin-independent malonate decarboxylase subunit beta [Actinoplanes humidus]